MRSGMRLIVWIGSPWLLTFLFWLTFVACVDSPPPDDSPPIARIVASWDPRLCGEPHRVVLELEDENGVKLSTSTRCALGALTLDAPHFGFYLGRIYAWELDGDPIIRSITPLRLAVDEAVVRWVVDTPR